MSLTDESVVDDSLQWALDRASTVKDLWHDGVSPDLAGVLETYPGLTKHRTIVVELAYEEFCLLRKAGESPDAGSFAAIPLVREVDRVLHRRPQFCRRRSPIRCASAGRVLAGTGRRDSRFRPDSGDWTRRRGTGLPGRPARLGR